VAGCCIGDAVCNDRMFCTQDTCDLSSGGAAGTCTNTAIEGCCGASADCMDLDGGPCTMPRCNLITGRCLEVLIDCDDRDRCTADSCNADGTCGHTEIDGCRTDDAGVTGEEDASGTSDDDASVAVDAGDFDADIDAAVSAEDDAFFTRRDAARDDAGDLAPGTNNCGCRAAAPRGTAGGLALALAALAVVRRRRRR